MVNKFYAIVKGREPGIYTDWETAKKQVTGYKGAIYKSFKTKQDAEMFMANSTIKDVDLNVNGKIRIYTDGSFADNLGGFGVIIIYPDNVTKQCYGKVPLTATNNVAELYAIYVALSLIVDNDIIIYTDSMYAISCMTTYLHNWKLNGWNGVANKNLIQAISTVMGQRKINFIHVDAHSGIQYNEEADFLANKGRLCSNDDIVYL